jgi:UDP-MurNAc hydroxylase
MKIKWVNHASFILECGEVKLITDPWIEGTAFDNGWSLLSETKFRYEDFANITHIWFSHEHPDHFSPPNLNKIPADIKKQITVLFQNTVDGKVANYCKKAGFREVIEMKPDTYYQLSDKVECLCNAFTFGDSYIYFIADGKGILNINDCIVDSIQSAELIKSKIKQVDILFTQFGYANKIGNTEDVELRIKSSQEKLQRITYHNQVFKPKTIVPFASFVYFCHEENRYMNTGFMKIDEVYKFITETLKTECVVLYPGEEWEPGTNHASEESIKKYREDYKKIDAGNFIKAGRADEAKVIEESKKFALELKKKNTSFLLNFMNPMKIYVKDYGKAYSFSLPKGLTEIKEKEINCDVSVNSEALLYTYKFPWGGDTLQVNARFQVPPNGIYLRARQYYVLASFNNRGEKTKNAEIFEMIKDVQKRKIIGLIKNKSAV